jgi:hypothetical protein
MFKYKKFWRKIKAYFPWNDTNRTENDASNNFSIVAFVFVAAETFLPSHCLATVREYRHRTDGIYIWSTYQAP